MKNSMLAKTLRRALWGAVVFYFGTLASAQTFNEDTPVLAAPKAAAKVVGNARGSAVVKVVKRQGFWLEVEAGAIKGWVKISAVKLAAPIGPTAIDTGRLGSNNIVATSAARGLSAKDLLEGRSDEKAIERLNASPRGAVDRPVRGGRRAWRGQAGHVPEGACSRAAACRHPIGCRSCGWQC